MHKSLRSIFAFSAFLGAVSLNAQTADEILARHLVAVGGSDVISHVKSLSLETTNHIADNDVPGIVVILAGVAYRSEVNLNGARIVQCYTANGGWTLNPMAGITAATPMPDEEYQLGKNRIYVNGDLHDYAAAGNKIELLSKDANSYSVKLTTKDNVETTYVFDASTYLMKSAMRKSKFQGQEVNITTSLSDYRKTDEGFVVPYSVSVDFGGQYSLNITVNKVEVNKPVDPDICAMPKASPAPAEGKATAN